MARDTNQVVLRRRWITEQFTSTIRVIISKVSKKIGLGLQPAEKQTRTTKTSPIIKYTVELFFFVRDVSISIAIT